MAELKLAGNHMRGSRPCLSFHGAFDDEARPHWGLLKAMLLRAFATPRRHPKSKPFFDHVLSFTLADNKIWIRNYQVVPGADRKGVLGGGSGGGKAAADVETATAAQAQAGKVRPAVAGMSLVEVGPRACLEPIKIFAGSFGGRVLYDNAEYVSPNTVSKQGRREEGRGEREKKSPRRRKPSPKGLATQKTSNLAGKKTTLNRFAPPSSARRPESTARASRRSRPRGSTPLPTRRRGTSCWTFSSDFLILDLQKK